MVRRLVIGGHPMTDVADAFGVSRQRVDQIVQPQKSRARGAAKDAQARGDLTPPSACERCGAESHIEKHHHDYAKPLDVEWLCVSCHKAEHAPDGRERVRRVRDTPAKSEPISCRLEQSRMDMIDAMTASLGFKSRSEVMRYLLREGLDRHFAGRAA